MRAGSYRGAAPLDVVTRRNHNLQVRVTWDEAKRTENLRKHGLDFLDAESVFDGPTVTLEDDRFDYGEQRWFTPNRMRSSG